MFLWEINEQICVKYIEQGLAQNTDSIKMLSIVFKSGTMEYFSWGAYALERKYCNRKNDHGDVLV